MKVQTVTETRANLKSAIDYVVQNNDPILIVSPRTEVVLLCKDEYEQMLRLIKDKRE